MSERKILGACTQNREAFNKLFEVMDYEDFSEQGRIILASIEKYYDTDPEALAVDQTILTNTVLRSVSNPKHQEMFEGAIKNIYSVDGSIPNITNDLISAKREAVGGRLATALLNGSKSDDVLNLMETWGSVESVLSKGSKDSTVIRNLDITTIVEETYASGTIKLMPLSLHEKLGLGLVRGHHVLIFARPEMGKTLVAVNSIAGFLDQDLTVLYVLNEDPLSETSLRCVSRLSMRTKYEIVADPEGSLDIARSKGYENLIFADLTPGTPREIDRIVDEHKPDVVVIDQLRNILVPGTTGGELVKRLEQAGQYARRLAKSKNVLVVSVTQAGDSATGKQALDMGDVDNSNTGLPGTADLMIGVGGNDDTVAKGRRILSLCKNKPGGGEQPRPCMVEVTIDPRYSIMRGFS